MTQLAQLVPHAELQADKAAVAATNFCSLWPAGKAALQALVGVVSSSLVKFAINTVISAGDAYCGSGGGQLQKGQVLARLKQSGISSIDDLAQAVVARDPRVAIDDSWIIHSDVIIHSDK